MAGWRLVTGSSPGVRAVCAAHRPCRPSGPSSVHHCCVPREKKKEANGSRDRLSFVGSLRGLGGGGAGGIDVKATVKSHVETGQSSRNSSPIPTSLVRNPYSSIRTRDSSSLRPRLIDSYGRIRGKKKADPGCVRVQSRRRLESRHDTYKWLFPLSVYILFSTFSSFLRSTEETRHRL